MKLHRFSGWVALSLVSSLMVLAGLIGSNLSHAQQVPANEPGARVIHFPQNRSLGTLRFQIDRNPNWHYISQTPGEYEWAYLSEAKGDVVPPVGKRLVLGVREDAWSDLAPLAKLAPDDLYQLAFHGSFSGGGKPGDSCMPHLVRLTGLKELTLWNANITYRGLEHLKKLQSLKSLNLYSSSLGEKEIDVLAELASPEKLKLFLSNATDAHLSRLAKVKSLAELQFSWGPELKGPGLARLLAESPSLNYLQVFGKDFDDSNLRYLENAPFLRRIRFSRKMPITDAGLAHLSSLTQLEDLRVYDNPITDAGLVHLKSMGSLRRLTLDRTQVTDDGMALVKQMGSLESLSVPFHLTDRGLAHLAELPQLKHLWAGGSSNSPISDEGLAHLSKLHSLEELLIGGTGITDAGLSHIAKLANLQHLALFHAPLVTNEGVARLTALKSLSLVELPRAEITIAGLTSLGALSELRILMVRGVRQDDSGLDISGLTKLEKLTLSPEVTREGDSLIWDSIHDEDLAGLANLTRLEWLQGIRGDISDAGMAHLAGLKNMERLNISGLRITDKGLSYLTHMKKLNHLTITGNFTDEGLRHLEGLETLSLLRIYSSNNFSAAVLQRLRENLPNLHTFSADPNRAIEGFQKRPEVVNMAPPFMVQTLDGEEIKLEDYRGKVVLLYFWATWCTPCVASTPALKKLYEELSQSDHFAMLSLSMDVDEAGLRRHVKQYGLRWPQARIGMHSQIAADYGVTGAPAYVLVGPEGRVLLNRERDWNKIKAEVDQVADRKDR